LPFNDSRDSLRVKLLFHENQVIRLAPNALLRRNIDESFRLFDKDYAQKGAGGKNHPRCECLKHSHEKNG